MCAHPCRRHGSGEGIGRIDWRDLKYRTLCAVIAIGWFGFVGMMLADALRAAP